MKKIILLVLCISFAVIGFAKPVFENGFISSEKKENLKILKSNQGDFILKDNRKLKGNSFIELDSMILTLVNLEDGYPVKLRIYNENEMLFEKEYSNFVNLKISENEKFIYFSDRENSYIVDLENLDEKKHKRSTFGTINNRGKIATFSEKNIIFNGKNFKIGERIKQVIFYQDRLFAFGEQSFFTGFENNNLKKIKLENPFFKANIVSGKLYISTRNRTFENNSFEYFLYEKNALNSIKKEIKKRKILRDAEETRSPLNYSVDEYEAPIGNSYAEIQDYSGSPYLHPGVDYLGDDYQEVYAVRSGYVKGIITTGGDPYWRVGIANEDSNDETQGYLYAHLNQNSFTVEVGDYVEAGEQIGTLYPWGFYDFTHIHFARIKDSGETWTGNWTTVDDVLRSATNFVDNTSPVFENTINSDMFAFRQNGNYLSADSLFGDIEIISKCYDKANSDWKIDIYEMNYSFAPVDNPEEILFEDDFYKYDFPLDVYYDGAISTLILNTIYSRDSQCYSIGNYDAREYYHILTASDGDDVVTENDSLERFDTTVLPNGSYLLSVTAFDSYGNEATETMEVKIANENNSADDIIQPQNTISVYPNPYISNNGRSFLNISFEKSFNQDQDIDIFNLKGQVVQTINLEAGSKKSVWNGKTYSGNRIKSGIYFIKAELMESSKKVIILK